MRQSALASSCLLTVVVQTVAAWISVVAKQALAPPRYGEFARRSGRSPRHRATVAGAFLIRGHAGALHSRGVFGVVQRHGSNTGLLLEPNWTQIPA